MSYYPEASGFSGGSVGPGYTIGGGPHRLPDEYDYAQNGGNSGPKPTGDNKVVSLVKLGPTDDGGIQGGLIQQKEEITKTKDLGSASEPPLVR